MRYKLIQHNSDLQVGYGYSYADTRKHLTVGKVYDGEPEVHDWYTKIWIDSKPFNSVCFEAVE